MSEILCQVCGGGMVFKDGEPPITAVCGNSYVSTEGCHVQVTGPNRDAVVRAVEAMREVDRRCGTCAAWQGIRGDEGGICRALPMMDSHHRSQLLDEDKDGDQCALWRLRGAE